MVAAEAGVQLFFGHSRSMVAAEAGSNHSKFSINELMNVIATSNDNIDELYMRSLNSSALCEDQPKTGFVDVTVSSLRGCRQVVVKLTMHVLECMLHRVPSLWPRPYKGQ